MKIDLAVKERAARKLARLRERDAACDQGTHQLACDDRRAVQLQFEHRFAGVTLRRGKENREPAIERRSTFVEDRRIGRDAWPQRRARANEACGEFGYERSAYAHNRDRALAGRRRNCRDRVQRAEMTTRRSGSSPSDSVRTAGESARAR